MTVFAIRSRLSRGSRSNTHETGSRCSSFPRAVRVTGLALVAGSLMTSMTGCDSAGEGLFTGAAVGALSGLAIGSLSGNAGDGAAIGAIVGGVGGAVIGDQNERNRHDAYISGRHHHPHSRSYRYDHTHPTHHSHRSRHHGHEYRTDDWWND
jgi:Glycine zipper